jgi:hypothetical protein
MKIVRNVATNDMVVPWGLARVHDEILIPITSGKTAALGTVWTGNLAPKVDAFVAAVQPLVRGFALGHIVNAESAPGGLDLGKLWTGFIDLRDALLNAVSGEPPAGSQVVDLGGLLAELESFRASVGSRLDMNAMKDALAGLKRARDAVNAQARAKPEDESAAAAAWNRAASFDTAATWGANFLAGSRDRTRNAIAAMSAAAARRYAPAAPMRDSTGGDVRDAVDRANKATDPRDQIRAINDANRAFHAARTRDHLENVLPRSGTRGALERHIGQGGGSGAQTPAEINEQNRRFWAGRS